jgi:hypothetical protein
MKEAKMYEFIKSPSDVLALKLSGSITGEDLDAIMDRVEDLFVKFDKIQLYVETHGIKSLEFSAMPHHFTRAFPLFSDLGKFGRVAVVADQAWMRVLTRLESALLPNVSYRVFEPEERKEALDWVYGKEFVAA